MTGWSSRRCALTWKIQGTPSNRIYYQLEVSARPTDATEFGSWLGTPTATGNKERSAKFKRNTPTVMEYAKMLPAPTTDERDAKYKQGGTNLRAAIGQGSQLNPRFVAEMMGFPVNWTELPFLSGEQKA
jgi:hypothetical protein